jgi:hypothetical protein
MLLQSLQSLQSLPCYRFATELLQFYYKTPTKALQALQALQPYKDFLCNPEFADVLVALHNTKHLIITNHCIYKTGLYQYIRKEGPTSPNW